MTPRLISEAKSQDSPHVFRNPRRRPWKKVTGDSRFRTIKTRLGWNEDSLRSQYSCYTCRHTLAHRMLAGYWNNGQGCPIEVLAELMGDTPQVAINHYGKEWGQAYQEPLWSAVGTDQGKSDPAVPFDPKVRAP